jgi:hypothetical protein
MRRTAPLEEQAAHAEREAFDHALAPYFSELLQAARREVRHRLTIGQFEPDNPTPEELLEKALQYAWRVSVGVCLPHSASKLGPWPPYFAPQMRWARVRLSDAAR